MEYEFTVTADLDYEHTLLVDKTRCHPLAGKMFKFGHTAELAETLRDWLGSAAPMATHEQVQSLRALMDGIADDDQRKTVKQAFAARYNRPERLLASQVGEAEAFVKQAVGA